jgi:transcriptional regulator with XRE-family HTH domain/Zn-dependent peptidase ImmA (M78 family)
MLSISIGGHLIGDRIKRKRQALGLSLQDLADRLEGLGVRLSRAALSTYETNKASPNAKTLWGIAKILNTSMDYFVAEDDTKIVLQGFRKKASLSQTRVEQIKAYIHDEIEKRIELDSILGDDALRDLPVQRVVASPEEAEELASAHRIAWNLGDQPISSVTSLLEAKGWYVIQIPNEQDFDGMAGYVESSRRPFAVTRGGIAVDRIRLNLLHEAGHAYVSGQDDKESEKFAFRFAASLLFPKERVLEEIGRKRTSVDIEELLVAKARYGLSMQAIAYRLRDLGVISESLYVMLFRYFNGMGFRVEEPGSSELKFEETPMAFRGKVHRAFSEALIPTDDAERFLPGFRSSLDSSARLSSVEIKRLLSLSSEERNKVLEASAQAVLEAYSDTDVNISGLANDIIEHS